MRSARRFKTSYADYKRWLVEELGGAVAGFTFLIELTALGGRALLGEHRAEALLTYD